MSSDDHGVPLAIAYVFLFASLGVAVMLLPVLGVGALLALVAGHLMINFMLPFTVIAGADQDARRIPALLRWFRAVGWTSGWRRKLFAPVFFGTLVMGGFVYVAGRTNIFDPITGALNSKSISHFQLHCMPLFDLRAFQNPTGADLRSLQLGVAVQRN